MKRVEVCLKGAGSASFPPLVLPAGRNPLKATAAAVSTTAATQDGVAGVQAPGAERVTPALARLPPGFCVTETCELYLRRSHFGASATVAKPQTTGHNLQFLCVTDAVPSL